MSNQRPPSETPAWIRQRIPTGGQHFPNAADVELHSVRRKQSGVSAWRKPAEGGLRQVHGGLCDAGAQGNFLKGNKRKFLYKYC
ncbi:hypothetical protein J6590_066496 [Homalodisca vitripennis]|nr:hypothetical protein J6590_066496 [Homalodisca vitripennis]